MSNICTCPRDIAHMHICSQMWVGRCVLTDLGKDSCIALSPVICRFPHVGCCIYSCTVKSTMTPGHGCHHQEKRVNQSMEKEREQRWKWGKEKEQLRFYDTLLGEFWSRARWLWQYKCAWDSCLRSWSWYMYMLYTNIRAVNRLNILWITYRY